MGDNKNEQLKRLEEFLSGIDIRLSKSSDGALTACTLSEPLFCFVRPTAEELNEVVLDTIISYVKNFWDGGAIDVSLETVEAPRPVVPHPPIPIEALVTFSRTRPVVRRSPKRELEPA